MKNLCAVVLTKNEEDRLSACLKALAFAPSILVVDSGSTDGTLALARRFTDNIISHDWEGMAAQRAWAIAHAHAEWVLAVDADEIVTPELAREIDALPERPENAGYFLRRDLYYQGRLLKHGGCYPEYRLRLVRKDRAEVTGDMTHDKIIVNGKTARLTHPLNHFSYRNLADHLDRINRYTTAIARERYEAGRRWHAIDALRFPFEFVKRYIVRAGFLDGEPGLQYALMASLYSHLKYAKLKELASP